MLEWCHRAPEFSIWNSDFGFDSSFGIRHLSFTPERLHRIDFRRSSCGQPAGEQRNGSQQKCDASKNYGITGFDLIKHGSEDACQAERGKQTEPDTARGQTHALPDDELKNIPHLRAQSHANPDL